MSDNYRKAADVIDDMPTETIPIENVRSLVNRAYHLFRPRFSSDIIEGKDHTFIVRFYYNPNICKQPTLDEILNDIPMLREKPRFSNGILRGNDLLKIKTHGDGKHMAEYLDRQLMPAIVKLDIPGGPFEKPPNLSNKCLSASLATCV